MNLKEVKLRVGKIRNSTGDPEMAHCLVDELYIELLRSIAEGSCEDPQACAREALATEEMDFPKWCA